MTREEIVELVSCTPLSQSIDFIDRQQAEIVALKAELTRLRKIEAAANDMLSQFEQCYQHTDCDGCDAEGCTLCTHMLNGWRKTIRGEGPEVAP